MKITVTGEAKASFAPELAVCHLALGFESGDLGQAVQQATELAETMNREFRVIREDAASPVIETVLNPLSTRSWRPWAQDGSQLPLRHHASSRAKLTFNNFSALSAFIDGWSRQDGVTVEHVEWKLTDQRSAQEKAAILAHAVADAHHRATVLAGAAGEGAVRFVELSDRPFPDGGGTADAMPRAAMMRAGSAGGEGIDLAPEDIDVRAEVHARFTTD